MRKVFPPFACVSLLTLLLSATACPTMCEAAMLIDFEGLVLSDGDPVPAIDGVTFDADIVNEGAPLYAFFGTGSNPDIADSAPFSNSGNVFIVNPGGFSEPTITKQVAIQFPQAVTNLSFLVADVDRDVAGNVIEQVNAEVFDSGNSSLGVMTVTAALTDSDGDVALVDFGSLSGITQLVVELSNIGTDTGNTALGFGVDDIRFSTAAPVPEPSSLTLLSLGFLALIRRRRSRQ